MRRSHQTFFVHVIKHIKLLRRIAAKHFYTWVIFGYDSVKFPKEFLKTIFIGQKPGETIFCLTVCVGWGGVKCQY